MSENTAENMDEQNDKQSMARLDRPRFKPVEYERVEYVATVEAGLAFEQVLNPEFWAYVEPKLKPYDLIEVRSDDGLFFAKLLVLDKTKGAVKTKVIYKVDLDTKEKLESTVFRADWKGPHKKWCVIRESDNVIVEEGIASKQDAHVRASKLEAEAR